jgi:hypothetical protein
MPMIKLHVISDLYLGFNEFATEEHTIPEVDIVFINGNLGHPKRSMLYAETLCRKYPNIPFVVNLGETERYYIGDKYKNEMEDSLKLRKNNSATWPKNLYWDTEPMIIDLGMGKKIDVFCIYGFPYIHSFNGSWTDIPWSNYHAVPDVHTDCLDTEYKPTETSHVKHGRAVLYADQNWINEKHIEEENKVRKWELTQNELTKVLVTHINPINDNRCINQTVTPYKIHLYPGIWIASNTKSENTQLNGARLISNPGRNVRTHYSEVKIF